MFPVTDAASMIFRLEAEGQYMNIYCILNVLGYCPICYKSVDKIVCVTLIAVYLSNNQDVTFTLGNQIIVFLACEYMRYNDSRFVLELQHCRKKIIC